MHLNFNNINKNNKMNLEKTTILLKKINRLNELISQIGEASTTEKGFTKGIYHRSI